MHKIAIAKFQIRIYLDERNIIFQVKFSLNKEYVFYTDQ